ncbi:MAG: hypothetical protein WCJ81_06165 [bacterium]
MLCIHQLLTTELALAGTVHMLSENNPSFVEALQHIHLDTHMILSAAGSPSHFWVQDFILSAAA